MERCALIERAHVRPIELRMLFDPDALCWVIGDGERLDKQGVFWEGIGAGKLLRLECESIGLAGSVRFGQLDRPLRMVLYEPDPSACW